MRRPDHEQNRSLIAHNVANELHPEAADLESKQRWGKVVVEGIDHIFEAEKIVHDYSKEITIDEDA